MGSNYLGRKAAYALHKRYPSGSQTASQLAAERANLAKARAARGQFRQTGSVHYHGFKRGTFKSRADAMAAKTYNMQYLVYYRNRPLDTRYARYKKLARIPKPRIYGIPKKFRREVAPSRFLGRTAWGAARSHKFRRRVYRHQHRFKTITRWKYRGRRYTPR